MSEVTQSTQEVIHQFPCPGCGADMVFDVEKQALSCPYCENIIEINAENSSIKEYPIEAAAETASRNWGGKTVIIHCDSCGAETVMDANRLTAECAFCGSIHIRTQSNEDVIKPESLVPFKIDKQTAINKFRTWLKKRYLSPGNLKILAREEKIHGVYIPFWTFDADTNSFYTAEKGIYYYDTERVYVKDGKGGGRYEQRRVRKTRWYPTSGVYRHYFNDVLVCASNQEGRNLIKRIEPFYTTELVPYRSEYLPGFCAEKYSIGLEEGFIEARARMDSELRKLITRHIAADEVRNLRVRTSYSNVKFKHILLPVWIAAYRYGDRIYKFVVNGQTGLVKGEAPVSIVKAAAIAVVVLSLIVLYYFYRTNG
ncbi:hypothetical protein CSTERLE_04130 [Thermoclostridium stercorarium subsp. leptospartum DSM 9219]|jgi:ribosomal protein S27E|uniref:Uncharacterized protein n=1 Tax=Thermoclostridium stercorarium subsp. leptospartum DSM 9219 TaxID=1346611 RepID=A0A1B1YJ81_THEST|nr:hypothetical protein [Thermoclostridium stercorarium]ANX00825.1 hypothetical protein CSTERLE_04130 [Thermoclostridium stercorarium subsp. leptospartum DSM 9219]